MKRASTMCHDCVTSRNICEHPPKLIVHMYLSYLDHNNWQGNLVPIKAYLLTQDLSKTQFWLWTDSIDTIVNNNTRHFFHMFSDLITPRHTAGNTRSNTLHWKVMTISATTQGSDLTSKRTWRALATCYATCCWQTMGGCGSTQMWCCFEMRIL